MGESSHRERRRSSTREELPSVVLDLFAAVDDGDKPTFEALLVQPNVSVNCTNKHGETPLHVASGGGHVDIVKCLHEKNAFIDVRDKHGNTPLYWAARHGQLAVVQFLCQMAAALNVQDKSGETALHVAARYGHSEIVQYLCAVGASLDIQDKDGETTLHASCWHGFYDIVQCLCHARAMLDKQNKDGETPLHMASVRGYLDIVRCLCEAGCQLDIPDKNGSTAMHLAVRRQHLDIVQYLVNCGSSLDLQDKHGETCLHDACREGHLPIVHTLYAGGCDLNVQNKQGVSSLQLASKHGHFEVVRCLVLGGCDVHQANDAGQTADDVASMTGNPEIAELLLRVKPPNMQSFFISQLAIGVAPLSKVKLFVCGHAGVGKSTLIASLKCGFFRSLFRWKSATTTDDVRQTHGIHVQEIVVPHAGLFSVWDMSGNKRYFAAHEYFLGGTNTIYLVTFSLRETKEQRRARVLFWLALIKAKLPRDDIVRHRGLSRHRPHIVLVATRGDLLVKRNGGDAANSEADEILQMVQKAFSHYFEICGRVFVVDARHPQSRDVKALRLYLGQVREKMLQSGPLTPRLCGALATTLPQWRQRFYEFPVLPWPDYVALVEREVNPLVGPEKLKLVTKFLNDSGDLIYIDRGALGNLVVLDPNFLCSDLIGPALAPEGASRPRIRSMTGRITVREIERVYGDLNALSVLRLFEHFELCRSEGDGDGDEASTIYEFPILMEFDKLHGIWVPEPEMTVYVGVRIECRSVYDILPPGFFPKLQLRLRKQFSDDFDDQELTLWSDGLKCVRGDVEIKVEGHFDATTTTTTTTALESHRAVTIAVRGAGDNTRRECVAHLQRFHQTLQQTIDAACPGTFVVTQVLSARHMAAYADDDAWYEPEQIFQSQRGSGVVCHQNGFTEKLVDLLCGGCGEMLLAARSAPLAHVKLLDVKTRQELSRLLDPVDPLGRDWCLLALSLGLVDELPLIDIRQNQGVVSATDRVLREFEKRSSSTVALLVDSLREIGRLDAMDAIICGLPLVFRTDSDVVVNVTGVEMTSYAC